MEKSSVLRRAVFVGVGWFVISYVSTVFSCVFCWVFPCYLLVCAFVVGRFVLISLRIQNVLGCIALLNHR